MNIYRLFLGSLLMTFLSACSTFSLVDPDFKPHGKSLAVVAGVNNDSNVLAAKLLGDALGRNSRFQVMSQKQVAQLLPGYPFKIQGPYKSAYFEIDEDYSKTDLKKIKDLQRKLGVDYMYVMWAPCSTSYNGHINMLHIVAQLFEAPMAKEVGNGKFMATAGRVSYPFAPTPSEEAELQALKDTAEHVAKEIAQKTSMTK
jgi:hypothetical protein